MKKSALYARVSSDRQKEEKTIDSQIATLKERIKEDGNILVGEFVDEGWSGETIDRPELANLRERVKNGEFEAVYIYHLDRLSRELGNQLYVISEIKRCGVEIYTSQGKLDDDPNNRLLMQMQGIVAEQEKIRILERTRGGRLQKAKRGVVVGSLAPYGYEYIKKDGNKEGYYVIKQNEAEVVKRIFNLFIELRSIRAVAKKLLAEKISAPTKSNTKWGKSTIHRILTREDYIGTAYYNKFSAVETKSSRERKFKKIVRTGRKLRDKKEWIPITVPSILDKQTFLLAQNILSKNREGKRRETTRQYLLSGLIRCDVCGSTYCGNPHKDYLSYRCNNRVKNFPLPKDCNGGMVKTEKIDNLVWESVKQAILKPEIILKHLEKQADKRTLNLNNPEEKIIELKKKIDGLQKGIDRMVDIFSEGLLKKSAFIQKTTDLNKEIETLKKEIAKLEEVKGTIIDKSLIKTRIKYFCALAKKRLDNFDFNEKKQFLNLVLDGIKLNTPDKTLKIQTIIPLISQPSSAFSGLSSLTSLCYGQKPPVFRFEIVKSYK